MTPTDLNIPTLLMNFPFTVDNRKSNNIWMESNNNKDYNYGIAFNQFTHLYRELSKSYLIYLLPSEGNFQDQTFVANLGVYLPHIKSSDIIILSNFKSVPRRGEEKIGRKFLLSIGYECIESPFHFEGEADLRWIDSNIYFGGYGIRTDLHSYKWMQDKYALYIVPIEMLDKKLYHFDCVCSRLTKNKTLVATEVLNSRDVKNIEKFVDIVDVPKKYLYHGWTNILVNGNKVYHTPPKGEDDGAAFINFFSKIGYEAIIINLSEYELSGSDLSCFIMKLNGAAYGV